MLLIKYRFFITLPAPPRRQKEGEKKRIELHKAPIDGEQHPAAAAAVAVALVPAGGSSPICGCGPIPTLATAATPAAADVLVVPAAGDRAG